MYSSDVKKYEGKIVLLDLVSGLQVTAEIDSVDDRSVSVSRPVVFQIVTEPADPTSRPSPNNPIQQKLNAAPYGGPFSHPKDEVKFDLRHVIGIHEPVDGIEKAYLQATSGIQVAGADTINQLDKSIINR